MNDSNHQNKFYINSSSWRVPALFALIIFALSVTLKHHFFYIHFYLMAAGALSLIISYRKYAKLTDNSLTLYTGVFRKEINLDFGVIDTVKPEGKLIKGFARTGPIGDVPYNFEIEYVLISLLEPLEKDSQTILTNNPKSNVFNRKIEVTKEGNGIILYEPPRGGFRPFLNSLSKYIPVLNIEEMGYESKFADLLFASLNILLFAGYILLTFLFIGQIGR